MAHWKVHFECKIAPQRISLRGFFFGDEFAGRLFKQLECDSYRSPRAASYHG